jgi:hypothetical protein
MRWQIEFGGDPQDVTITTGGTATREGFFGFNGELVADPRWRPGMAVLLDHSALDMTRLTCTDVEEIAGFVVELDDRLGPALAAIIAPDSYTGGVTDVSIQFVASSRLRACTFPSHERAVEWLGALKHTRMT